MQKTETMPAGSCPVAAFQKMINGKYKLRILLTGMDGTREIAPRVLSRELKALTQSGLVDRKDYGVVPPKVEYRLTLKGRSFVPVIAAIRKWGELHLGESAEVEAVDEEAAVVEKPKRRASAR
jgi:DNA-binding HxlR family transcriptional regulator